jgi:hypothetical protein
MRSAVLLVAALLWTLTPSIASTAAFEPAPVEVSAQGVLRNAGSPLTRTSPLGTHALTVDPREGGFELLTVDLDVRSSGGATHRIAGVRGNDFLISDLGQVLVLETAESNNQPSALRVYNLAGGLAWERTIFSPMNPVLSTDGATLVLSHREGTLSVDLADFRERELPYMDLFAGGPGGLVAGVSYERGGAVLGFRGGEEIVATAPGGRPRRIAFGRNESEVFVLDAGKVSRIRIPGGDVATVYASRPGEELRDLRIDGDRILIGLRRMSPGRTAGEIVTVSAAGQIISRAAGPERLVPPPMDVPAGDDGIPWPLNPNMQHPVGNTYGEYQYYGGSPYPHPGVDVMGIAGQPVFAVRGGIVKAILTTSGEWHWRVAVGDEDTPGTCLGYLYAHLDQPTIAVDVGDPILPGQYLGDLVEWPIYGFHHCHFTRLEDSGATWDGVWLSVHNPHIDITNQSETEAPVFEPAIGSDLLAFCRNQTSTYLDPDALTGSVDVIAHVGDRILSSWVCAVQELRYTIYPAGMPQSPIVDDKLSVYFDMTCDTYASGEIDAFLMSLLYKDDGTCNTQGDYDYREFFHILTNSNGDTVYEPSDLNEAWDTTGLPDGGYVVKVKAIDVRGNVRADSMIVTTANGPIEVAETSTPSRRLLEPCVPNPAASVSSFAVNLLERGPVALMLYDASGRLVRTLHRGPLSAGRHAFSWDARDDLGRRVGPGSYFLRLESREGSGSQKVVLSR